jgi:hypothetical protein
MLVDCFFGVAYLAAGTKPTTASAEGTKETDVEAANEEVGTEETYLAAGTKPTTASAEGTKETDVEAANEEVGTEETIELMPAKTN